YASVPQSPHLLPLSLHDALPICSNPLAPTIPKADEGHSPADRRRRPGGRFPLLRREGGTEAGGPGVRPEPAGRPGRGGGGGGARDRKSTRLNSSHGSISYAVFCL